MAQTATNAVFMAKWQNSFLINIDKTGQIADVQCSIPIEEKWFIYSKIWVFSQFISQTYHSYSFSYSYSYSCDEFTKWKWKYSCYWACLWFLWMRWFILSHRLTSQLMPFCLSFGAFQKIFFYSIVFGTN